MKWNQATVYQALVGKGYYEKPGDKDKHVCISPEQGCHKTSMIFHHPDARYKPLHVRKAAGSFSQHLLDQLSPCLKWCSKDKNGWDRYDVTDYDMFAEAIGLGAASVTDRVRTIPPNGQNMIIRRAEDPKPGIDPEFMNKVCDKLIAACDLIAEDPRTGETHVMDTPEEAKALELSLSRKGFKMVTKGKRSQS